MVGKNVLTFSFLPLTEMDYENITFFFIINSDQREGRDQGFGSGSVVDHGSRRAKMTHKSRKN
jgi:hypothetical protein